MTSGWDADPGISVRLLALQATGNVRLELEKEVRDGKTVEKSAS